MYKYKDKITESSKFIIPRFTIFARSRMRKPVITLKTFGNPRVRVTNKRVMELQNASTVSKYTYTVNEIPVSNDLVISKETSPSDVTYRHFRLSSNTSEVYYIMNSKYAQNRCISNYERELVTLPQNVDFHVEYQERFFKSTLDFQKDDILYQNVYDRLK
jgi:hypothetical protein